MKTMRKTSLPRGVPASLPDLHEGQHFFLESAFPFSISISRFIFDISCGMIYIT